MSLTADNLTGGGLFSHYDAALEVGEPARKASDAASEKQLETPVPARTRRPRDVMATAALAAGTVRLLGGAVDAYNRRVDELNDTWRAAKDEDFGVGPMTCPANASDEEVKRTAADHADRLLDAKLELLSRLEAEHRRHRRELEAAIEAATERLANGPSDDSLRGLVAVGGQPYDPMRKAS